MARGAQDAPLDGSDGAAHGRASGRRGVIADEDADADAAAAAAAAAAFFGAFPLGNFEELPDHLQDHVFHHTMPDATVPTEAGGRWRVGGGGGTDERGGGGGGGGGGKRCAVVASQH